MDTVNEIKLTEAGAPSLILRDLSEYTTLAFIASFDVPQVHKHSAEPSIATQASDSTTTAPQRKRITYIALAKLCMPKLAELFLQFKDKDEIFVDGTVEAVLSAYAVPIKLKYECPPPSKFGKDLPLWKTATTCFLKVIKEIGPQIGTLGSSMTFHSWSPPTRVLTRLQRLPRIIASEGGEHLEAGDRSLPRWRSCRLVRHSTASCVSNCFLKRHA